jgi:hypothetical protein
MHIREATIDDVEFCQQRSVSRFKGYAPDVIDFAYCIADDETRYGIMYIKLFAPGAAMVGVNMADTMKSKVFSLYRFMGDWLNTVVETHGIRCLLAFVHADFEDAIRLVEHLGFVRKATLETFNNGSPGFLYERAS